MTQTNKKLCVRYFNHQIAKSFSCNKLFISIYSEEISELTSQLIEQEAIKEKKLKIAKLPTILYYPYLS